MNLEKIKQDFPLIASKKVIYFDNACQSLRPKSVIDKVNYYYKELSACAGRSNHKFGEKVSILVEEAREAVRRFINAKYDGEIIFTKNTTESINLVARSLGLKQGDVVLATDKEHNSNLIIWQYLAKKIGIIHQIVSTKDGEPFDLEAFRKFLTPQVKLVSFVWTSNLDGTTVPAKEIIELAHKNGSLAMLDGAQYAPHHKFDVQKLDVDFVAFSGHKILGPSGVGILYGKLNLLEKMEPFILGGDTVSNTTYSGFDLLPPPNKFEAGLQNYSGILGLTEAIKYLESVGLEQIEKQELELNELITNELGSNSKITILGPKDAKLRGSIFSFYVKGLDSHQVALMLDQQNIMVRSGRFCVHSWFNSRNIESAVRASFYFYNTEEEARKFVEEIKKVLKIV